jgi:pimeloyl-ACP methyl ester carboxylesterase
MTKAPVRFVIACAVALAALAVVSSASARPLDGPGRGWPSGTPTLERIFGAPTPCPEDGPVPGGLCGSVTVPLDRANPGAGTIDVAYMLYPATDASAPAVSTVVVSDPDGPGISTLAVHPDFLFAFEGLRARHDMLFVDRRGTGGSGALDCPALQNPGGGVPLGEAIQACATQLGSARDFYTTADAAQDVEAVRAELGIAELDYLGFAYGAADAIAYAVRFPQHVRSLVLGSPYLPVGRDPFNRLQVKGIERAITGFCARSTHCSRQIRHPMPFVRELIEIVRAEPVTGTAIGPDGSPVEVTVDESVVAQIARNTDADMLNLEELPAAGRALARGDSAPLLRLAGETLGNFPPDVNGPPDQGYSAAANVVGYCSESPTPWSPQASSAERRAQFDAAVAALPATAFGPFSVDGWTGDWLGRWQTSFSLVGAGTEYRSGPCIDWPAPGRTAPIVPPGASYPDVPVLVTGADTSVHTPSEESRAVAALFPSARYVEFVGGDHIPAIVEPCVAAVMARFIESFDPGDTTCAPDPGGPWYTPGDFPLRAANAVPARIDQSGRNQARRGDRRIVAAGVAVLADAFYHSGKYFVPVGPGLRGGSYETVFGEQSAVIVFRKDRFVRDVAVDGRMTISYENLSFTATLRLSGPALRGRSATLRVKGQFYRAQDDPFVVRGHIGGRRIAALVDVY